MDHNKQFGIFYTPKELAIILANELITPETQSIFDPAYGEGSLLLAAQEIANKNRINQTIKYYGCDLHPVNGLLSELPNAQLEENDFFCYTNLEKFNVILTNPPYIRYRTSTTDKMQSFQSEIQATLQLKKKSDTWAFFIVKALSHLKEGGSLGAILPWSFLQADFAIDLRVWLLSMFKNIDVWALSKPYFSKTSEKVLILWMKGYGSKNQKVRLAFSFDVNSQPSYLEIDEKTWASGKVSPISHQEISSVETYLEKNHNFKHLSDMAKVRIGVVTGADQFFIRRDVLWKKFNFSEQEFIPIITSVRELEQYIVDEKSIEKKLVVLEETATPDATFIKEGMELDVHLRSHSKNRRKWYSINPGKIPDAFFTYRVASTPFLVLNTSEMQCTNSIHRIYFTDLNERKKKWIFVSILSVYGQLFLEYGAKTYGRGVLKIEPTALANIPVIVCDSPSVDYTYSKIFDFLKNNKKQEAVVYATDFINLELKINSEFFKFCKSLLEKIRFSRENNFNMNKKNDSLSN